MAAFIAGRVLQGAGGGGTGMAAVTFVAAATGRGSLLSGPPATGQEVTYAYYNAVLRDWGRLGLMLAHKGAWAGSTIVSEQWLAAATSRQPASPTYGYQIWLSPINNDRFYLWGLRGQFVLVDPKSKTTLVQTSLDSNQTTVAEISALWLAVLGQSP